MQMREGWLAKYSSDFNLMKKKKEKKNLHNLPTRHCTVANRKIILFLLKIIFQCNLLFNRRWKKNLLILKSIKYYVVRTNKVRNFVVCHTCRTHNRGVSGVCSSNTTSAHKSKGSDVVCVCVCASMVNKIALASCRCIFMGTSRLVYRSRTFSTTMLKRLRVCVCTCNKGARIHQLPSEGGSYIYIFIKMQKDHTHTTR